MISYSVIPIFVIPLTIWYDWAEIGSYMDHFTDFGCLDESIVKTCMWMKEHMALALQPTLRMSRIFLFFLETHCELNFMLTGQASILLILALLGKIRGR